jgi:hypothetical protein
VIGQNALKKFAGCKIGDALKNSSPIYHLSNKCYKASQMLKLGKQLSILPNHYFTTKLLSISVYTYIDLEGNNIEEAGLIKLGECLSLNASLQELSRNVIRSLGE